MEEMMWNKRYNLEEKQRIPAESGIGVGPEG